MFFMSKLCPKLILEGTRLTHKIDIAFALNEHIADWLEQTGGLSISA